MLDARVHYVVLKQQPRHRHPDPPRTNTGHSHSGQCRKQPSQQTPDPPSRPRPCCLKTQQCAKDPTPNQPAPAFQTTPAGAAVLTRHRPPGPDHKSADIPPMSTRRRTIACATGYPANPTTNTREDHERLQALLRKEVIQPHLPVRLPCYDLVPIAGPTFDGSLPQRG